MPESALKAGWTRVALGDVVRQVQNRVDPAKSGLKRFVAGEHMDSDDLHIRRWGTIGAGYLGPAFHMRFKPGQVLYGSRRTYLRKVALADFEGVTANTTFVIESKNPKILLPDLLPFIMQTDSFHEHSKKQSKGSVNPYVNFSDLTWYEFALPPLEEQRRAALAMWAAEMHRRACRHLADSSTMSRRSLAGSLFAATSNGPGLQRLGDAVAHSAYGPRFAAIKYVDSGNVWTVRTTDFAPGGGINYSSVPAARLNEGVVADHRLIDGDFLLSRSGEYAGMVRVFDGAAAPDRPFIPAAFLIRFRLARQNLSPRFLFEYCESALGEAQLKSIAQGSAQPNISGSAFMNLQIPIPSLPDQEVICKHLEQARLAEIDARDRLLGAERLSKEILALVLVR